MSAPATHFDDAILSFVTADWQPSAVVVGRALVEGCGDVIDGNSEEGGWSMSTSWVRRRNA